MSMQGVAKRLRDIRKRNVLTQQELADKLGVSLITVSRWENGERTPNITVMDKLSKLLNVPISYFTEDTEDAEPVHLLSKSEQSSERKQNMAVITLENGRRVEAPATPEGYAFLKDLFSMSLMGQPAAAMA